MGETTEVKLFPFDDDLQYEIVRRYARDRSFYLGLSSLLDPKCFSNAYYQIIVGICTSYFTQYKSLISSRYMYEMCKYYCDRDARLDLTYFTQLTNHLYQLEITHEDPFLLDKSKIFLRKLKTEKVLKAVLNEVQITRDDELDFDDIKKRISLSLSEKATNEKRFDHQKTATERVNKLKEDALDKIRTVICPELDKSLDGGLGRGELMTIIAPSGRGKTLVLANFAKGALMGAYNPLYVTLETSGEVICQRVDSSMTSMTRSQLRDNPEKGITAIDQHYSMFGGRLFVVQYAPYAATTESLEFLLDDLDTREDFKADCLIVDYGDLMLPSYKQSDRRFELTQIFTSLRKIGVERDIPVFTASQSNRTSYGEDVVDLQHMAEDIGKVQVSDVIISLSQTRAERESDPEIMRLYMAKNRNNAAGFPIPVEVYKSTMQLRPSSAPATLPSPDVSTKSGSRSGYSKPGSGLVLPQMPVIKLPT